RMEGADSAGTGTARYASLVSREPRGSSRLAMQTANRRFWRNAYFWILSAYVASRVAYFAAGIRFNVKPLSSFFQIADPLLLRTRLFETLLYLHTQPPGFNLMIGLVLKVFPSSYSPAFHFIYLACGVSLCFTLYRMMR